MTARPTADLIADLRGNGAHWSFARNEAADRLAELDAEVNKRILERAELWKRWDELSAEHKAALAKLAAINAQVPA